MAYTIIRSNGTTLTTIQDGTINTTSTSLGLPGRNYAGYGQSLNTNFVRLLENYASADVPPNPLRGQIWFNTQNSTLNVCPTDNETNAQAWLTLASTNSGGSTTLGNITVTGNVETANLIVSNDVSIGNSVSVLDATVTGTLTADDSTFTTSDIGTLTTAVITTGSSSTAGTLTGAWSVVGNAASGGNAFAVVSGNIAFAVSSVNGIKCDNYMYANGATFNPSGTYNSANVFDYLTGSNSIAQFTGNIAPTKVTTTQLAGGGTISGIWTLATGARIQASYADLAERFEADSYYDAGTVVELGGDKEITSVQDELSEEVFGVISHTAAYLMNNVDGYTDVTHPPVAVSGRVPVKVIGKVKKGQRLVSAGHGYARAAKRDEMTAFNVIGRALENKTTEESGTVLAIVSITK